MQVCNSSSLHIINAYKEGRYSTHSTAPKPAPGMYWSCTRMKTIYYDKTLLRVVDIESRHACMVCDGDMVLMVSLWHTIIVIGLRTMVW